MLSTISNSIYLVVFGLLWAIAVGLVPFSEDPPRRGKDFALFIAIDRYDHWENLKNPVRDAEAIAAKLESNYGFKTEIIRNPTERELLKKLNQYARRTFEPDEQLLIFFAGHGYYFNSSKEGFILSRDALGVQEDPFGSSFIPLTRLRSLIANMKCRHTLLILDSCYSGTFNPKLTQGRGEQPFDDGVVPLNSSTFDDRSLFYLTSGKVEIVDDGTDHSPFTHAVLKALEREADFNRDGIVRSSELFTYVKNNVRNQEPTSGEFEEHQGGDFLFIGKEVPLPVVPLPTKIMPFTNIGDLTLSPTWSPDGQWIAYASNQDGDMDIWKKRSDRRAPEKLTDFLGNETDPAWSPDGHFIAFASEQGAEGGIMLLPVATGKPFTLSDFGDTPAWSSDGRRLAFQSKGNVYVIDRVGGTPQLLVSATSANPHPVWAGNDRYIVYWNRTAGDIFRHDLETGASDSLSLVPAGYEPGRFQFIPGQGRMLLSLGPFGGNKRLFEVIFDTNTWMPVGGVRSVTSGVTTNDIEGVFSPDGKRVAYVAQHEERQLYMIPLDTTTGLATGDPVALTRHGKMNYYPSFSSDGRQLVWTSHRDGQGNLYTKDLRAENASMRKVTTSWDPEVREINACFHSDGRQIFFASTMRGSYELWRVPSSGMDGNPLTETKDLQRDIHPALSPNDRSLVFYSNRAHNWDIWMLEDVGEKDMSQVTDWPGNELYPCWSPDGRRIAFQTDRDGSADIWTIRPDGSDPAPLVVHPAEEVWGAWSPNGRWFYFVSDRSGQFNIWRMPARGGEAEPVTTFSDPSHGLPGTDIYTKFAVANDRLIFSREERRGDILLLK